MANVNARPAGRGRTLGIYLFGVFLGALDSSILAPAFPLIAKSFHIGLSWDAWTISTYTIAYAAATVLAGAAGDRYGRRKLFGLGVALFGLGSLAAATSGAFWLFLLARVVQGAGAGAIFPNAQAEGIQLFPPQKRGRALGLFGAIFGLATMIGPNVGGILAQVYGWQSLFWINVPLAAIVLATTRLLPAAARTRSVEMPDWRGGVAFAGLISSALFALASSGSARVWLLAAAVAFGVWFIIAQRGTKVPFIKAKALAGGGGVPLFAGAMIVGLNMSALVFVPLVAQQDLGFSVLKSGVALTPMALLGALLTGFGGVLIDRIGALPVVGIGMTSWAAGGALLALLPMSTPVFFCGLGLFGLGTAFTMGPPLNKLALAMYEDARAGEALSLMSVFRSIGIAGGPVILAIALHGGGDVALFGTVAAVSVVAGLLFIQVGRSRLQLAPAKSA